MGVLRPTFRWFLVRQLSRCLAHVQLARHHVGDKPGAVFLHQLNLAAGASDGSANVGGGI